MARRIVAFLVALAVMAVLGSIAHTLVVQADWAAAVEKAEGAAAALPFADRLNWIVHDLIRMETGSASGAPPYALLAAVALLLAFLAAGLVARFTGLRTIVFAVAGAVGMFVVFWALRRFEGTAYIFGARGMGVVAQMAAGLIAGAIFAMLSRPREA